jgi:hypothetical protein
MRKFGPRGNRTPALPGGLLVAGGTGKNVADLQILPPTR